MEEYYPIIKIPNKIQNIWSALPEKPKKPSKPKKPDIPQKSDNTLYWILIPAIIAFFLIIISIANGEGDSKGVVLLFFIPIIFYSLFYKSAERKMNKKYINEMKAFEESINHYNTAYANYNIAINKYYEVIKYILSDENVHDYRKKTILKFLKGNTIKPSNSTRDVKEGLSEKYLLKHLIKRFGDKIFINSQLGFFDRPYVPDFVYFDKFSNILIDIEIDEPYTLINEEYIPIHYLNNTKDRTRDAYFLNSGWIVIRISESQAVKYPDKVCDLIESIFNNIIDGTKNNLKNLVPLEEHWTDSQSLVMSNNLYRNTYLTKLK